MMSRITWEINLWFSLQLGEITELMENQFFSEKEIALLIFKSFVPKMIIY
jgi:hypothetical protein